MASIDEIIIKVLRKKPDNLLMTKNGQKSAINVLEEWKYE